MDLFQDRAPVDTVGQMLLAMTVFAGAFDQITNFKIKSVYKFFMFWGIV